MAYSESLLYSGYQDLNLTKIFMSGIFYRSFRRMMDLAVDITSAVNEVVHKKAFYRMERGGAFRHECGTGGYGEP